MGRYYRIELSTSCHNLESQICNDYKHQSKYQVLFIITPNQFKLATVNHILINHSILPNLTKSHADLTRPTLSIPVNACLGV